MQTGVILAGGDRLAVDLQKLGVLSDEARRGLVYDASQSVPASWDELATQLDELFELTQQAVVERAPLLYILHEPSLWGHEPPLRSALATALLGGMRSAAVELARHGVPANAVATDDDHADRVARMVGWLLQGELSGQVLTCGSTHLGRPAV